MPEEAHTLFTWISTTGTEKSLIMVKDSEKNPSDIDYKRLEICSYDSDNEQWETEEKVDYVDEITSFGIPEALLD